MTKQAEIEAAWAQREHIGSRSLLLSPELRWRLAAEQGWRCKWCERRVLGERGFDDSATLDLVIPHKLGGAETPENCVVACRSCNTSRNTSGGDRMLAPQIEYLKSLPVGRRRQMMRPELLPRV